MLKYNLQVGKTFDVVAMTKIKINFFKSLKIFEDKVSFIITCKVRNKQNGIYTLDCVLSWLDAKSFMHNFWQNAVGDRFVVRKNARGEIVSVRGGEKIRQHLFGMPLRKVLLWFGTILSGSNPNDEQWTYDDGIFYYHFSNSKERNIGGRKLRRKSARNSRSKLPMIAIDAELNDEFDKLLKPFVDFKCNGEVLFDVKSGRIGVSRKNLHATLLNILDFDVRMKAGETHYLS